MPSEEERLSNDVASLVRVRNRLSISPDHRLPKILSALLPKLLTRLQASLSAESCDNTKCRELTLLAQEHIHGILRHALERLRGHQDMPWSNIMSAVLPFLNSKNSVLETWALIYIQGGIPRCTADTLPLAVVSTLIQSIDQLHCEMNSQPCKTGVARLTSSSWMFLDCIIMKVGLRPFIDWDLDFFDRKASNWEIQPSDSWKSLVSEQDVVAAADTDGAGVFHLLLDLMLFWPHESAMLSGLSVDGELRLGNRGTILDDRWSDMAQNYLRELKLASLRFAIWPPNGGLFQQQNSDRALVLAVLSACTNSMHGRLATEYVSHFSEKQRNKKTSGGSFYASSSKYSLNVACGLLILIVGDQRALPLLENFEERCRQSPWTPVIGVVPSQVSRQRPPLPVTVISRAVTFLLMNRLSLDGLDNNRDEIQLLMDLTRLLTTKPEGDGSLRSSDERKHAIFWGVQLMKTFLESLEISIIVTEGKMDEWSKYIVETCLGVALDVVSVVVEIGESNVEQPRLPNVQLLGGVEAPFHRRLDLSRMLNTHRASIKRRKLGSDDAIRARKVAYEIIGTYASHTICRESRPFELPVCLLRCSVYEDDQMQHYLLKANNSLLDVYSDHLQAKKWTELSVKTNVDATENSLQQLAVPLLPALLDAVCSDVACARLVAIEWIRRLLLVMDMEAACYLLNFLVRDPDDQVSSAAKRASERISRRQAIKEFAEISIIYIDKSTSEGMEQLKSLLKTCLDDFSGNLEISHDTAAVLLFDFKFSQKNAAVVYNESQQRTLDESGIVDAKPDKESRCDFRGDVVCGICYDTLSIGEAYALSCGHEFCRECWNTYLQTAGVDKKFGVLDVRCPQQECGCRVLPHHLQALSPLARENWDDTYFQAFLQMNPCFRICPDLKCECVAVVDRFRESTWLISCQCTKCKSSFCFDCGEKPHQPASCVAIAKWARIQSKSDFWVRKNSKPCPACNAPIQKTQGCNHMTCNCGAQFCWLCLTQLSRHSENHMCNRYDPADDTDDDFERRALYVAERYDAHLQAEQFAESQRKTMQERPEKLVEMLWFLSPEDEDNLNFALETLCESRKFLRNSYVAFFGLSDHPPLLETLENYQSALEMLTERLSQLTETNLQRLYLEKGEQGVKGHFHGLGFYRESVANYLDRFNIALWQLPSLMVERQIGPTR